MSLTTFVAAAVIVVLVLCVSWVLWRLVAERSDAARDETIAVGDHAGPQRFDTTLGELRDLRQALGSSSSAQPDDGRKADGAPVSAPR